MRSKDSCPVWGEGAGKVPYWQLADALLYCKHGSEGGGEVSSQEAPPAYPTETRGFAWLRRRAGGDRARPAGTRPCLLLLMESLHAMDIKRIVCHGAATPGLQSHCP